MVMGRAMRCNSGKSIWTLSHCAWQEAKRSVMTMNFCRTAPRWSKPFFRPKSERLFGADFIAQEGEELLVLLEEGVLEVGAKDMVAVLDLVDDGGQFAFQL